MAEFKLEDLHILEAREYGPIVKSETYNSLVDYGNLHYGDKTLIVQGIEAGSEQTFSSITPQSNILSLLPPQISLTEIPNSTTINQSLRLKATTELFSASDSIETPLRNTNVQAMNLSSGDLLNNSESLSPLIDDIAENTFTSDINELNAAEPFVNFPPDSRADRAATQENETITIDVLANDTDLDTSDTLTLTDASIVGENQGSVAIEDNQLVFNPGSDFDSLAVGESRDVTVNYTVSDTQGATSSNTATITVTGSNDGPVANADIAETAENQSITIDVLANDTDLDTSDTLTLTDASIEGENQGSVAIEDNRLVFNPGSDFDSLAVGESKQVSVNYTISDSQGATSTSQATITVTGSNDGPVANADIAETAENQSITIDVLANDTDLDTSDTLTLTDASIVGENQGSVAIEDNQLVFNPGSDFDSLAVGESRDVTVNYTVSDSQGATSTSQATITVTGTNDGPVANADIAQTQENNSITIDVLANDIDLDTSDTLTLTAASIEGENQGSVIIEDNQLVFNPGTDFDSLAVGESHDVTVNYTVSDS